MKKAGAQKTSSLPDPRSGIVLVAVLWTMALLSALAMAASTSFRGFAGIVAVDRDRVHADALLSAGLDVSAIIVARTGEQPLTKTETVVSLPMGSVLLRLSDEGGRIDINKAPVPVLTSLMRSIGAGDDADTIARSIEARRARDQADHPIAAPSPAKNQTPPVAPANQGNPAAGQTDPAANKPDSFRSFTDVRQLSQIPGMTADYLDALSPLTTVFGDDKVSALAAPPEVIGALPNMNPGRRDAFIEARQSTALTDDRVKQMLGTASDYVKLGARPVALVEMTARLLDGYMAAAEAVIVVVPDDIQPYRVLAWTPVPLHARRSVSTDNRF
jgi:general secretion pathway protein K